MSLFLLLIYTSGADVAPFLLLLVELLTTFGALDFIENVVTPRVSVVVAHYLVLTSATVKAFSRTSAVKASIFVEVLFPAHRTAKFDHLCVAFVLVRNPAFASLFHCLALYLGKKGRAHFLAPCALNLRRLYSAGATVIFIVTASV
jgi:hypothetical protein